MHLRTGTDSTLYRTTCMLSLFMHDVLAKTRDRLSSKK